MLQFEAFVEASRRVASLSDLRRCYFRTVDSEGYENGILHTALGRKVAEIVWHKFPDGYGDAYIAHRWESIDPIFAHAMRARRAFLWSDVTARRLSKQQRSFMDESRDLKVHSGILFPFHGPGHRLDIISVSRRTKEAVNPAVIPVLHAISSQAWLRYLELSRQPLFVGSDPEPLSSRELEILKWCKDGKSRRDIQEILSVTRQGVDYHITKIFKKLGASNRISAVVIALQRGLIDL